MQEAAVDHDSLDLLAEKLKAVAKVNQEALDEIEASKSNLVVTQYGYVLKCDLGQQGTSAEPEEENPWGFVATPHKEHVLYRLQKWGYAGEQVEEVDDFFNDKIQYQVREYKDVKRLNNQFLRVGMKNCELLADKPKPRVNARLMLKIGKVQVAVGELHALIFDAQDEVTGSESLKEGMEEIVSGFQKIQDVVGEATLKVRSTLQVTVSFPLSSIHPITLELLPFHTVIDVKKMIEERVEIPPKDQRIFINKEILEDERTLSSYGIQSGTTMSVSVVTQPTNSSATPGEPLPDYLDVGNRVTKNFTGHGWTPGEIKRIQQGRTTGRLKFTVQFSLELDENQILECRHDGPSNLD